MPRAKKTEQVCEANSKIEEEKVVHKDGMPMKKKKPAWTVKGSSEAAKRMQELRQLKKAKRKLK